MSSTIGIDVREAGPADFDSGCDALAAGFFDDPFMAYMFPDPGRRARFLPAYFAVYSNGGQMLIAGKHPGDYAGAAVHFSPAALDLSPEKIAADNERVYATCGPDAFSVVKGMNALAANHPHEPKHFYLLFLAVRRERRGGVGLALISRLTEIWDREGLYVYGEATTTQLKKFYGRCFEAKPFNQPIRLDNGQELFPGWRTPRPLQRRCSPAVQAAVDEKPFSLGHL